MLLELNKWRPFVDEQHAACSYVPPSTTATTAPRSPAASYAPPTATTPQALATTPLATTETTPLATTEPLEYPLECFVCASGEECGPLVTDVCACKGRVMHVSCQLRMIESCTQWRHAEPEHPTCPICLQPYSNARVTFGWRPTGDEPFPANFPQASPPCYHTAHRQPLPPYPALLPPLPDPYPLPPPPPPTLYPLLLAPTSPPCPLTAYPLPPDP